MGYLRLCILEGIDCSYPKSHYTSCLDLRFKSYGVLKISATLRAGSQPLSMQQFLPKTAQICLKTKLWNSTKNWDFNVFQKQKFLYIEQALEACFHRLDFQSKNVSYAIFIVKKQPLYVNFSIPPCGNWWFSQGSTPRVGMRFCGHVPNSPRNKNLKRLILNLLKKVVFLDPKRLLSPFCRGKKNSHKW
jgi:hypothetical protein